MCSLLDRRVEKIEVQGLGQVREKARIAAILDVSLRPETADGNSGHVAKSLHLPDEFVTACVWQSDVAHQHVDIV
jgi:hypothetical protein